MVIFYYQYTNSIKLKLQIIPLKYLQTLTLNWRFLTKSVHDRGNLTTMSCTWYLYTSHCQNPNQGRAYNTCGTYSDDKCEGLQAGFATTIRDNLVSPDDTIDHQKDIVTEYVNFCTDLCLPKRTFLNHPNQKPWVKESIMDIWWKTNSSQIWQYKALSQTQEQYH